MRVSTQVITTCFVLITFFKGYELAIDDAAATVTAGVTQGDQVASLYAEVGKFFTVQFKRGDEILNQVGCSVFTPLLIFF